MNGIYLFVDHNCRFRISESKPEKLSMRESVVSETIITEDYHGHNYMEEHYVPGKTVYYWGNRIVHEPCEWSYGSSSKYSTTIPDFGTVIPMALVKDEYIGMTFDDDPVFIPYE